MAATTPVLAIKNLETWYGPVNAIKGINLEVQPGRIVTVLGANGAGKTTLLNTIAGVIDPFKGSINYKGQAIHGQDPDQVARSGVVLVPINWRCTADEIAFVLEDAGATLLIYAPEFAETAQQAVAAQHHRRRSAEASRGHDRHR